MEMDFGIPVEVQGKYGEYYPAYLTSMHSQTCVGIDLIPPTIKSAKLSTRVHPNALRVPPNIPSQISSDSFEAIIGQEVDVLLGISDGDVNPNTIVPPAWWPAIVQKVKGGFVAVKLDVAINSDMFNKGEVALTSDMEIPLSEEGFLDMPLHQSINQAEIVEKNQIRPRNRHPNLTLATLYTHKIFVPAELEVHCHDPRNFEQFAKKCGISVLVCLAPDDMKSPNMVNGKDADKDKDTTKEDKICLLVVSPIQATVKRASIIEDLFLKMLIQKIRIVKETEELSKRLEEIRVNKALYANIEEFSIPKHLVNRALRNDNMNKAKQIEGVTSLEFDEEKFTFRVCGCTKESVKRARGLLEFATESMMVPAVYIPRLRGKGNHLQLLVDRVGLGSFKVYPVKGSAHATISMVGTRNSINDMKLLLNFHIEGLRELDRLRGVEEPPLVEDSVSKVNPEIMSESGDDWNQIPSDKKGTNIEEKEKSDNGFTKQNSGANQNKKQALVNGGNRQGVNNNNNRNKGPNKSHTAANGKFTNGVKGK